MREAAPSRGLELSIIYLQWSIRLATSVLREVLSFLAANVSKAGKPSATVLLATLQTQGKLTMSIGNDKRHECHQALCGQISYRQQLDKIDDRAADTCKWFLEHPKYQTWRDSKSDSILWVAADPGCGKSVLCKWLVEGELKSMQARTTCYFFFKNDNVDLTVGQNALCALLHNLFFKACNACL